ncbi:hypothetical protein HZI73_22425 [Vallitalea pronyensis]|uniref:Uncharacterized protein n=1 Tax=Vallitalea pronyensis TaxID=1348613 RepID=A0A8J8MNM4_9FIRM|nr:hypothetical protein [Vallitalea pronyensis]QUI24886.1 hypothetical protein HZI73_22425 [Vallitalea pronyensis]
MTRYNKEINKCTLRSDRFQELKEWLHSRGIKKCSTKWSMGEAIKKYCNGVRVLNPMLVESEDEE